MGLCKTSNFSIFAFINASDLKFCPRSYSGCVYRRFEWKNCKMMTSHFRTPWLLSIHCLPTMRFVAWFIYLFILPGVWQRLTLGCQTWISTSATLVLVESFSLKCSRVRIAVRTKQHRYAVPPGAHHPERPSPILSLRDNLCPVCRERLSPLQSAYGRNQRGKDTMVEENGQRMRDFASRFGRHFFQRWFRSYTDRSGDRSSRETRLKIAQSGHRLGYGYSVDVRSGWWAPGASCPTSPFIWFGIRASHLSSATYL